MRAYEQGEVVRLWQSWANRSRMDYSPDTLSRRSKPSHDPRIAAYRWVEAFLRERFEFAPAAPFWLMGMPPEDLEATWREWYAVHPLPRTLASEEVETVCIEFEPLTAAEAAAHLGCTERAIHRAAKLGHLVAWTPRFLGLHTNRFWLGRYKAERPHGGVRKKAA